MEDSEEVNTLVSLGEALISAILERAPLDAVKKMIEDGAPLWYQDEDGTSALHAAAYVENEELVRLLIQEGAVWNAVDNTHNTASDIALSMNNEECYNIIRDAGIRSELLLTLLSSKLPAEKSPLSLILKATDSTAAGSTEEFLSSKLRYTTDEHGQEICLVKVSDDEDVGVMMGWERPIMQETVHKLCDDHEKLADGLKILNVGFGLGIIDSLFQELPTPPALHVIIEPHPDVLQHMQKLGWFDKKGVVVIEGKWQDFMESEELLGVGGFDVVYTDTFSEDYKDLQKFFEHVPDLLAGPESRFGFFNGLGATNALFYDVYRHVSELHLADVGVDVEWSDVDVFAGDDDRWGKTREYFAQRLYRLPVGKMRAIG
ncbi:S-adenosyl-L-methionine-dependent methyltransferase [Laetiporus sulphureus 93-53]|uniref:S-adenosyl-L-methionine-dependent methyltransferase n=1 Tax=Laetiporus sulphureus 93-53 TaxID=1314785 RepID=A0A165GZC1_9APHY|nr:S-adenosyl-L-methionine-dependent methyltransferase [Laetiporus sulphureus 93-53]KZT11035.1 S-adenosyl-L-methionine-dependent methyltransferase [Laetiporus sulphureus 93-53]